MLVINKLIRYFYLITFYIQLQFKMGLATSIQSHLKLKPGMLKMSLK